MRNTIFEEDRLLTKAAETPVRTSPGLTGRKTWERIGSRFQKCGLLMRYDRDFHIAEVAEVIGEALTDLMISREEKEIYTPKNRELVVESSRLVASRLIERLEQEEEGGAPRLSFDELHKLIEKALVENDAYDVAKSLVFSRSNDGGGAIHFGDNTPVDSSQIRLIRRSGQVVPWNSSKIEVAIRKAFLSLRLDSEPAVQVSDEVTRRAVATGQAFINIEDVQDIVQEELMKHGFLKSLSPTFSIGHAGEVRVIWIIMKSGRTL